MWPVSLRVTQELHDSLNDAARSSGRSMAAEIEARLERSLHEDRGFGGPEYASFARLMAAEFGFGQPDVRDPLAYQSAVVRVLDALVRENPGGVPREDLIIEALRSRLETRRRQERAA
jgi:Arc-like DNA binding domain